MRVIIQENEVVVLRQELDQAVIISQSGPPGPAGGGGGGGGVTDGDRGDIVVTGAGSTWTVKAPLLAAAGTGTLAAHVAAPDPHPQYALVTAVGTAIATREPAIAAGSVGQYWRGDKSWQTLNAAAVGLGNVNNTSDAAKPVSTAQQTALDLKANLNNPTFTGTVSGITRAMVGLGNVDNTSDAAKPVSTAQATAINSREPVITSGTVNQYWRGDKSWQALDAAAVGLSNVDNTSDSNKPLFTNLVRGLVPGSGGGTANFLRADGTWAPPPGGGGGGGGGSLPGGANRQVQFNNAGSLGGSVELLIGSDGGASLLSGSFDSTLPPVEPGQLKLFTKSKAGRSLLSIMGPSGTDTPLQPHLAFNTIRTLKANYGATALVNNGFPANLSTGIGTAATYSNTSLFTRSPRVGALSAATAGSVCGFRTLSTAAQLYLRAGRNNIFMVVRFGLIATVTDRTVFVGLQENWLNPPVGEPSTFRNAVGLAMDSTDTNLQIMRNGGSAIATKFDLGPTFPAPIANFDFYEFRLHQVSGSLEYGWHVENLATGTRANGTISSNAPALDAQLVVHVFMTNGATASAVQIGVNSVYLETDF